MLFIYIMIGKVYAPHDCYKCKSYKQPTYYLQEVKNVVNFNDKYYLIPLFRFTL